MDNKYKMEIADFDNPFHTEKLIKSVAFDEQKAIDLPNVGEPSKLRNNSGLFVQTSHGNSVLQNVNILTIHRDTNLVVDDEPNAVEKPFVYQCEFCIDSFSSDITLIDHCKRMHKKDVKCEHCSKQFYYKKDLNYHMMMHIKKGTRQKCRNCSGLFSSVIELQKHKKTCQNIIHHTFKCDVCDRIFMSFNGFKRHKSSYEHTQCDVCLKYFGSETTLLRHIGVHMNDKAIKYNCDQCDDAFATKLLLKRHHRSHGLYECELCSTRFRRKCDIRKHFKMGCLKSNLFHCKVCEKLFLDESNLKSHVNIHYERNRCAFCSEKFLESMELSEHLYRHNEIENFHCKLCSITFTSLRIFNSHMKSHVDQTKFKCEQCLRWFQKRSILKQHSIIHTEQKQNCTVCEMQFSDKIRLDQHMERHKGSPLTKDQIQN